MESWKVRNRGVLPKTEFPRKLKEAIEAIDSNQLTKNIKSGFRATGIVPINRKNVLKRIPGGETQVDDWTDSWKATIVDHLNQLRNKDEKRPRRKKVNIIHGKSLTAEEVFASSASTSKTAESKDNVESEDNDNMEDIIEPKDKDFVLVQFSGKENFKK